ncbi:uncharacterized protein VTP21DRAFT_2175 [Calcarisporiella thermophila]|uniref:uncharacterized protein n=1 Tax=Calcarisporiella thermophila TaxID=911321 RepID=UPI00374242AA
MTLSESEQRSSEETATTVPKKRPGENLGEDSANDTTSSSSTVKRKSAKKPKGKRLRIEGDGGEREEDKHVEYFEENGLHKVKPYFFEYRAYAKGRWIGKPLLRVFVDEFRDRTQSYYEYAIRKGLITLNSEMVSPETLVRNQDVVGHRIHRHEPPVSAQPIRVVARADNLVVIDKPASVPVHPSGRYRYNTVLYIMQLKMGFGKLYPVNRLDRLTSGLMILALTQEKARAMEQQMQERTIRKEYLCRVQGRFPKGDVECSEPILTVSHKLGLNTVHPEGKPCKTLFRLISYSPASNTSLVHCKPLTGRTHQIRVHLQFLGHPICGDPLYGNKKAWGDELGKGGLGGDESKTKHVIDRLLEEGVAEEEWGRAVARETKEQDKGDKEEEEEKEGSGNQEKTGENIFCDECAVARFRDPRPEELALLLHAWRYEGEGWAYETERPAWAEEGWEAGAVNPSEE